MSQLYLRRIMDQRVSLSKHSANAVQSVQSPGISSPHQFYRHPLSQHTVHSSPYHTRHISRRELHELQDSSVISTPPDTPYTGQNGAQNSNMVATGSGLCYVPTRTSSLASLGSFNSGSTERGKKGVATEEVSSLPTNKRQR